MTNIKENTTSLIGLMDKVLADETSEDQKRLKHAKKTLEVIFEYIAENYETISQETQKEIAKLLNVGKNKKLNKKTKERMIHILNLLTNALWFKNNEEYDEEYEKYKNKKKYKPQEILAFYIIWWELLKEILQDERNILFYKSFDLDNWKEMKTKTPISFYAIDYFIEKENIVITSVFEWNEKVVQKNQNAIKNIYQNQYLQSLATEISKNPALKNLSDETYISFAIKYSQYFKKSTEINKYSKNVLLIQTTLTLPSAREIIQRIKKDIKSGNEKKINDVIDFVSGLKEFVEKNLYKTDEIANTLKKVFIRLIRLKNKKMNEKY